MAAFRYLTQDRNHCAQGHKADDVDPPLPSWIACYASTLVHCFEPLVHSDVGNLHHRLLRLNRESAVSNRSSPAAKRDSIVSRKFVNSSSTLSARCRKPRPNHHL